MTRDVLGLVAGVVLGVVVVVATNPPWWGSVLIGYMFSAAGLFIARGWPK